jgi:hypothetical protein
VTDDPSKMNLVPTVTDAVPGVIVHMVQPPPHVPPEPNATPPGGRFGVRETARDGAGNVTEVIRWVDANGDPLPDEAG